VLLEFAVYRVDAAVYGWGYARLAAALAPALGGALGAWFASRPNDRDSLETAANGAAFAAAFCGISSISITWASQRLAKLDGSSLAVAVPIVAWSLLAAGIVTAVGGLLRAAPSRAGRHGFAFGIGGALGALLVPGVVALGCPRSVLLTGFVLAASSGIFARSCTGKLHWPVLVTVPLALLSLSLGDIRNPWLKVRTDVGRKGRIGLTAWTSSGLLQVDQAKAGIVNYTFDRGPLLPLALADKSKRRQAFELPDIAYFLNGTSGAALIVGSGGAREVREALDAGHPRVDAIEASGTMARFVATEFAEESNYLLNPSDQVTLRFGDARSSLASLRESYDRIVVVGEPQLEPVATRLFPGGSRLLTVEAIRAYIERLATPRGVLVLRVPKAELPNLLATVTAATSEDVTASRAVACAERKESGAAALLLMAGPPSGPELQNVEKSCKRKGLSVEYPAAEAKNGDRDKDSKQDAREAKLAALSLGRAVHDDRPFYEAALSLGTLRSAAKESLRALPAREAPKARAKDEKDVTPVAMPEASALGIASSGAAISLLVLLVVMLLPTGGRATASFPLSLRFASPLVGVASGLGVVVLDDAVCLWLGGTDWAWPVVIPAVLVSLGTGRALADALGFASLRRYIVATAVAAVVLLAALTFVGARLPLGTCSLATRLVTGFAVVFLVGAALGAPSSALLRLTARASLRAAGWSFGAFVVGTAFGTALGQLLIHYGGVSRLASIAAFALGLGSLFAGFAGLRPSSTAATAK